MKQPEALRIAKLCDNAASAADMGRPPVATDWRRRAAAELRRQHALIAELSDAIRSFIRVTDLHAPGLIPKDGSPVAKAMSALAKAEAQQ